MIKSTLRFGLFLVLLSACIADDSKATIKSIDATANVAHPTAATTNQEPLLDRTLLLADIADPDIFKDGDKFYLVGTGASDRIPFFSSATLDNFSAYREYKPGAIDGFDYCNMWAPELTKVGNDYVLAFTAKRSQTLCLTTTDLQQTIFYASAPTLAGLFTAAPRLVNPDTPHARSKLSDGCVAEGCHKTMRIDIDIFNDNGETWIYYTYFDGGNRNASFKWSNPSQVYSNSAAIGDGEEQISEAPEVFKRNGIYYFLFSSGVFADIGNHHGYYRMQYVMADSPEGLIRSAHNTHSLTTPIIDRDGVIIENHGHGSVIEENGEFFIIYHVGTGSIARHNFRRDTVKSKLAFNADGTIQELNTLSVTWKDVPGAIAYSLDIVYDDNGTERHVGPCVNSQTRQQQRSYKFYGYCPNASGLQLIPVSKVKRIQIFSIQQGQDWSQAQGMEATIDRNSTAVHIQTNISQGPQTITDRANKEVYVYILAGQSNMAGYTPFTDDARALSPNTTIPSNVTYFANGRQLADFSEGSDVDMEFEQANVFSFGPEISLSQKISQHYPDKKIMVIKDAIGGTSIDQWLLSYQNGAGLFDRLKDNVTAKLSGKQFQIKGVFWMQGEADAWHNTGREAYKNKLNELIGRFRQQTGIADLPFVFGKIFNYQEVPHFPAGALEGIRLAQEDVAQADPHSYIINLDSFKLAEGDPWHFDGVSQLSFGQCLFHVFQSKTQPYRCPLLINASNPTTQHAMPN